MRTLLNKLVRDEQGQDVIEYALLAAGISIVVVPTVPLIGKALDTVYAKINTEVGKL
jgi:Flp pilus assembly pilin Flp